MAELTEKLFACILSGSTVVMPTEEASRSLLTRFVLETGRGIEKDRVIAFDTFLNLFFPGRKGRRQADRVTRLLFAKELVLRSPERLSYFIPTDEWPELRERIVPYISSMLPHLDEAEDAEGSLGENVRFIRDEYAAFLEKAGLYEPNCMDGFVNALEHEYVVALPDRDPETEEILSKFPDMRNIKVLSLGSEGTLPPLQVYDNAKQEIRTTFLRISELMRVREDGTYEAGPEEIAISTADLEGLKPYLERESKLFDIPLCFMQGRPALEYPAGRFLVLLRELYENDYDMETMRSFFLNPAFPFRDREAVSAFVLKAINVNVKKRDRKKDRYFLAEDREDKSRQYYRMLIGYNDNINTTTDPSYLINQLKSLFTRILSDEQFRGNDEDWGVFSFIMKSAMNFTTTVRELYDTGAIGEMKLFPLFMRWMEGVPYVPQEQVKGVRVYPLPQAAGVYYRYHFIMDLNETDARKVRRSADFLADYEIMGKRRERDTTGSMLRLFLKGNEHAVFSASERTYGGAVLPLTDFSSAAEPEMLPDPIESEHETLLTGRKAPLFKVQRDGRKAAEMHALRRPGWNEDLSLGLMRSDDEFSSPTHMFSFSQVDKYIGCPMKFFTDYVFGLSNMRSYDIKDWPATEIGSRLHRVCEVFLMEESTPRDTERIAELLDEELALWADGLTVGRDGETRKMGLDIPLLKDEMAAYIRNTYLPGLTKILLRIRETGGECSTEERVEGDIDGMLFKGYMDLVLRSAEGMKIIDFKLTRVKDESLQFDIYNLLMGCGAVGSEYHLFKTGDIKAHEFRDEAELRKILSETAEGIRKGIWKGLNTREACEGCRVRGICRRRFFID